LSNPYPIEFQCCYLILSS